MTEAVPSPAPERVTMTTFEPGERIRYRPRAGQPERDALITEIEREGTLIRLHLDDGDAVNIDPAVWELGR